MTTDTTAQHCLFDLQSRFKDLVKESELLFRQLEQVQEELKDYYARSKKFENGQLTGKNSSDKSGKGWVDDELPEALAENQRLRILIEAQQKISQVETQNALNVKLGNLLIQLVDSPASFLSVFAKLGKIWCQYRRKTPPKALGGKDFSKLGAVYDVGGFNAVDKLLAGVPMPYGMQASAYTALSRQIMKNDRAGAVEAARRAYALYPEPCLLKKLAFRLYEANNSTEAEAMLDILPDSVLFCESETRKANNIRHQAKQTRQREAKQEIDFIGRRTKIEKQIKKLLYERDEHAEQVLIHTREIERLRQVCGQLEQEKSALAEGQQLATQLAEERGRAIEELNQAKAQLEQEKSALAEGQQLATQLAEERGREIEALNQVKAQLEQEKSTLAEGQQLATQLAEERGREIEALNQVKAQTEKEQMQLQQELWESRQAASLSMKLQMLREADLKDLQDRYQASSAREEHQHQLLTQLSERLNTASAYFRQIAQSGGEPFPGDPPKKKVSQMSKKRVAGVKNQS